MLTESLNIYVIDKDGNKVTFPNVEGMQPAIDVLSSNFAQINVVSRRYGDAITGNINMLDYNEPRNQLKEMRTETVRAYESINPSKIKDRIKELETVQNADGFWDDPENAKKASKENLCLVRT